MFANFALLVLVNILLLNFKSTNAQKYCGNNMKCVPHSWCSNGVIVKPNYSLLPAHQNIVSDNNNVDDANSLRKNRNEGCKRDSKSNRRCERCTNKCNKCETCCRIAESITTTIERATTTTKPVRTTLPSTTTITVSTTVTTPISTSTAATTPSTTTTPASTTTLSSTSTTATPSIHAITTSTTTTTAATISTIPTNPTIPTVSTIPPTITTPTTTAIPTTTTPLPFRGCGYSQGTFIIPDSNDHAEFAEFPWMVAILEVQPQKLVKFIAAGSIIAANVVLTATAKLNNVPRGLLAIRANSLLFDKNFNSNDKRVLEIITHQQFSITADNNIALLILFTPFTWNENVQPICLPPLGNNFGKQNCLLSSWNKLNSTLESRALKKIEELSILSEPKCRDSKQISNSHESFLCINGERHKGICSLDGGAVLVCPMIGMAYRYYQAGIHISNNECNLKDAAHWFVNISHFAEWIDETLYAREIDLNFSAT